MKRLPFFFIAVFISSLFTACTSNKSDESIIRENGSKDLSFESSDKSLEHTFKWAVEMALSYAHDGSDPVGHWYEAALPNRNAFCMRDASHQSIGAEMLGLSVHNHNMMYKFASNISSSKDWCSYWEIDKDNKPCPADYSNDDEFWYNLNANFDVMFACWRLYEWTGDERYINDSIFNNFYSLSAKEYIDSWQLNPEQILTRTRQVNARPDAKRFRSSRGIPSYVETFSGLQSSSDLVAAIYGGLDAYAKILSVKGEKAKSKEIAARAEEYRQHIENAWWSDEINAYHTFWTVDKKFADGEGLTHVLWFNAAQNPERIKGTVEKMLAFKEWNIENISHFPLLWYRYNYANEAYDILKNISSAHRCEYPEVSYGMIEGIVSGTMGINASASRKRITTLPKVIGKTLTQINNLPVMGGTITLCHIGSNKSELINNTSGDITWEAAFDGDKNNITVNGKNVKALKRTDIMGNTVSYVEVKLSKGERALCQAIK